MTHISFNLLKRTGTSAVLLTAWIGCSSGNRDNGTAVDGSPRASTGGATSTSPSTGGATSTSTSTGGAGGVLQTSAGSTSSAAGAAGATYATIGSGGTTAASSSTGAGGSIEFKGVPAVGDTVTSTNAAAPVGVVSAVQAASAGNSMVTIRFPAEWQCPQEVLASMGVGGAATKATTTDPTLAATDCHALAALRRPALLAESEAELAKRRTSIINSKCRERVETRCIDAAGKPSSSCYNYWAYGGASSGTGIAVMPSTQTNTGATEYSTTNTQVAAVDEADYVKNDGQTIYVLASDGLHVIDAWPAPQMYELTRVAIPGEPRRLFLSDNRLVVYTRMQAQGGVGAGSTNPSDQGCTYGYDCRFSSEGGHSLAIVYDVSSPALPRELARYEMSGGFVAARRVGSAVYTVVHDVGAPQIPGLDYTLQANSLQELEAAYAAKLQEITTLIQTKEDGYFLPWIERTAADGTKTLVSQCDKAYVGKTAQGMSFVSISAFDLTKLEAPTRTVIGSNPGYVYASATSLYLAVDQSPEPTNVSGYASYSPRAANSNIHKFSLAGTSTEYRGSIVLPGHILNQFAMDEHLGVLRVASTAGWVPDPTVVSYLTTIGEANGGLKQLGQIGGIAPTEDIRSVRFDAERGFVVTFKKTDPLFVFDLSDATSPKMMGELKIPGYSTYMHRLDQNHLLAVGFEADDQGSFAYFNGIQIQIFDITNLASPALLHKHVIGTRGSGSEALTNHLAFNYFPSKKLLALPITVCEGGGNGSFGNNLTFAGLMAFDISLESGIHEHGRLPFLDPSTLSTGESCSKWWTDATSLVKRSIFMDDWVYGLSDAQIRVANLASMSLPAAMVSLPSAIKP